MAGNVLEQVACHFAFLSSPKEACALAACWSEEKNEGDMEQIHPSSPTEQEMNAVRCECHCDFGVDVM